MLPALYADGMSDEWKRWLAKCAQRRPQRPAPHRDPGASLAPLPPYGRYAKRLASEGRGEAERRAEMRAASPKYVPREWMLAGACARPRTKPGPLSTGRF